MTKEALKLALEALVLNNAEWKHLADSGYWSAEDQNHYKQTEQAITAVQRVLANEALEKMAENARELGLDYEPAQEPVAWISATELLVMRGNALGGAKDWRVNLGLEPEEGEVGLYTTPPQGIYYTPPQRTWVGLTDEEILSISADCASSHQHMDIHFARAIEAALKAKNT